MMHAVARPGATGGCSPGCPQIRSPAFANADSNPYGARLSGATIALHPLNGPNTERSRRRRPGVLGKRTPMGLYNLDNIFHPSSIAVIGASERKGSIGRSLLTNLIEGGFDGGLYPVNPKYDRLQDRRCYARISDAPAAPDMAVIAIPIGKVPEVIQECVQIGVKGAVIISAGGREAGAEGRDLEKSIAEEAARGGLRIVGPNCLGIACPQDGLNASFVAHMPPEGNLAFISQSGAICSSMLDLSLKENMGYRYFISIGSMLDVDFGDLIDYVGNDPKVSSVLLYIESLSNHRKFMSAARAVSRMKPIVVLKAGRSEAGAWAASSHTGSMAGDDRIYDAAFRRAGAVRVRTIGEFFDCAELLAKQKRPKGSRITILTNSGGPGVMTADAVAGHGLSLSRLEEDTVEKLDRVLPAHWSRANPVDILGDADPQRYVDALKCISADNTDGLLVILNPQAMTDPVKVAEELKGPLASLPCQVFTSWMGGKDVERGTRVLNEAGIPTYSTPEQAVRAFRHLYDYGKNLALLQEIPPRSSRQHRIERGAAREIMEKGLERENGMLTECETKDILSAYRIPVNPTRLAESKSEAERVAADIGFPVAMKIASPEVIHKSRSGGVRLGLDSRAAVAEAYDNLLAAVRSQVPDAQIRGVSLQPMQASIELELLVGAKKDDNFGPVVLFGWGGVHTEVLADRSIALVPLNRVLARRLMEDTKVYTILSDESGPVRADVEALEEILICLSQLTTDFPQIEELDINPVAIVEGRPIALDGRIKVGPSDIESPQHLSISPYPAHLEDRERIDGSELLIRPIKPEDAPLLEDLFDRLSKTSIYHRFFSPMKSLPHPMLVRFTQIDYDREVAMVALDQGSGAERMIGVARVIGSPGGRRGEFAVIVADSWQGKGVGAELLSRSLRIVKKRGMAKVWGTALAENTRMAALARKLGFRVERNSGGEYEMTIDLKTADLNDA